MTATDTAGQKIRTVVKGGDVFNIVRQEDGTDRRYRVLELDIDQGRETDKVKSKVRVSVKTEIGKPTGTEVVEEAICERRKQDSRLFDELERHDKPLTRAFDMIGFGYEMATSEIKVAIAKYGERFQEPDEGKEPPSPEWFLAVERDFLEWATEATRIWDNNAFVCAVEIIVFGMSCRQVDANHRKRKGWAIKNLVNLLELYCDMLDEKRVPGWGAQ